MRIKAQGVEDKHYTAADKVASYGDYLYICVYIYI